MTDEELKEEKYRELREQAHKCLLTKYGHQMNGVSPKHTNENLYKCAEDWVSKGNITTFGIIKYYEAYYS